MNIKNKILFFLLSSLLSFNGVLASGESVPMKVEDNPAVQRIVCATFRLGNNFHRVEKKSEYIEIDLNKPYDDLVRRVAESFGVSADKIRLLLEGIYLTRENYIENFISVSNKICNVTVLLS
mgnify:CR=1 FL=1